MSAERCHLLRLPTELRLHIYDYALFDAEAITISSGEVIDCGANVYTNVCAEDSSGQQKPQISGLPTNHVPIIRRHYDPSLLSINNPPVILTGSDSHSTPADSFADSAYASATSLASSSHNSADTYDADVNSSWDTIPLSTPLALLSTCRTINAELRAHLQFHKNSARYGPALYVSYPTGLLVLKALCPHLLTHARAVYIAGAYNISAPSQPSDTGADASDRPQSSPIQTFSEALLRRRRLDYASRPYRLPSSPAPSPEATAALTSIVRTLLGPSPHTTLQKLQLRIYYPSEHAYRHVWGDDSSPIVVALRNTCGGKIEAEVWRGRWGTGLKMEVRSHIEGRVISTVWRRLTERGQSEGFVIGEEWPEERKMEEGGEGRRVSYGIGQPRVVGTL